MRESFKKENKKSSISRNFFSFLQLFSLAFIRGFRSIKIVQMFPLDFIDFHLISLTSS